MRHCLNLYQMIKQLRTAWADGQTGDFPSLSSLLESLRRTGGPPIQRIYAQYAQPQQVLVILANRNVKYQTDFAIHFDQAEGSRIEGISLKEGTCLIPIHQEDLIAFNSIDPCLCYIRMENMKASKVLIHPLLNIGLVKKIIKGLLKRETIKMVINGVERIAEDELLYPLISNGSVINIVTEANPTDTLLFKQPNSEVQTVRGVNPEETIRFLKKKICQQTGFNEQDTFLSYAGEILKENRTPKDYYLSQQGILYILKGEKYLKRGPPPKRTLSLIRNTESDKLEEKPDEDEEITEVSITVKSERQTFNLTVSMADCIDDVLNELVALAKFDKDKLKLLKNGEELKEYYIIEEHIEEGDALQLQIES